MTPIFEKIIFFKVQVIFKIFFKETLAHEETERKFLERKTLEDFGRSQIGRLFLKFFLKVSDREAVS